jgi:multiple sugar transport system permease protein
VARVLKRPLAHAVLIMASAVVVLPLLWVVGIAATGDAAIGPLARLARVFAAGFGDWLLSSLVVAMGSAAIVLPLAVMLAYPLAGSATGWSGLRFLLLVGALLPPVALALPAFAIFLTAELLNTHEAIMVAHLALNLPVVAWVLSMALPARGRVLEEALRLEGASRLRAFALVALPVAAPRILAAGLLAFALSWGELLLALVLSGRETATLPVGLATADPAGAGGAAGLASRMVMASLPILFLLPFMCRQLVPGLSSAFAQRGR